MDKKGLSDIVNTILIILLILIAIGIIWFFIRPFIFNTSENLEGAGSCFQTTVEPTKCVYTKGNSEQKHIFLSIKREGQAGNISGINLIFTTKNGEYRTFRETQLLANITLPDQFETRKPIIKINKQITTDFIPRSIRIAIILGVKKDVCPPFSQEIACTEYIFAGRSLDINGDSAIDGIDYDLFHSSWEAYCQSQPFIDPECLNPNVQPTYTIAGQNYDLNEVLSFVDFNEDLTVNQEDYRDFISIWES